MIYALFSFFVLISSPSLAMEVVDYTFTTSDSAPSCRLLLHRKAEREKVLREFKNIEDHELLASTLLTNKYFYETAHWSEDTVWVHVLVNLDPKTLKEILTMRKDQLLFRIEGQGILWQSLLSQLPHELKIYFHLKEEQMEIHYPIYLSELCLGELAPPLIQLHRLIN